MYENLLESAQKFVELYSKYVQDLAQQVIYISKFGLIRREDSGMPTYGIVSNHLAVLLE